MIKVQGFNEKPRPSQPSRQDYVFEEKQKSSFAPIAFLAVLAGIAVYLKSFLPTAKAVPDEVTDSPAGVADGKAQETATVDPATETPPAAEELQRGAASDSDNVVPMMPRRTITKDMVDSFLASDSPSLAFTAPKPGPAPRVEPTPAANDNGSAPRPVASSAEHERVKSGGGGGSEEPGVPRRRDEEARRRDDERDVQPVGRPRDEGETGGRNRPPRTNGAVILPDLVGCEAYFIPALALLAGASDPDGDKLQVLSLRATSGTLVAVEGGWMFTADHHDSREVVFNFAIGDGTVSVPQLAHLSIVDAPPIFGTDGDDNLLGTSCGDRIDARDGDDNIDSRQGNDVVVAGNGDDHVVSGDGNDLVQAGAGNDIVFAGAGNDIVFGGSGRDRLFGEAGDDTIFGEHGDDTISGGSGDDVLLAGAGDDVVHGDAGNDVLDGGEGADLLHGGEGVDKVFGGAGEDVAHGDAGNDVLDGGDGSDRLYGGEGSDTVLGGAGDDFLSGDEGNDVLEDGAGSDTVDGGEGNDHVKAAADSAPDTYEGGDGDDTLDYSSAFLDIYVDIGSGEAEGREIGRDFIAGFEKIIGGQGDDRLVAGSGSIQMTGGEGDDTYEFKSSDDDHQPDLVRKITDFTLGDRIIAARYEIFYRDGEDGEQEVSDLFEDIYLSENSDRRPIRFRFEKLEDGELTFVDVHDKPDSEEYYSIELSGHHDLQFTVVVS